MNKKYILLAVGAYVLWMATKNKSQKKDIVVDKGPIIVDPKGAVHNQQPKQEDVPPIGPSNSASVPPIKPTKQPNQEDVPPTGTTHKASVPHLLNPKGQSASYPSDLGNNIYN
jgi:hypothetical protein